MRYLIALVVCAAGVVVACGKNDGTNPDGGDDSATRGLASCPAGTAVFTVSPIALSRVDGWIPLGQVGPPAHTFPTDHQYVSYVNPDITKVSEPADVVAPSNITIIRVRRVTYSSDNHTDYTIDFAPCADIIGIFGHVTTLDATLLTRLGAFDQCSSYSPNPGLTILACDTKSLRVEVPAGGRLGTAGGQTNIGSLDFTLQDRRVTPIQYANPARWIDNKGFDQFHIVPASEYFVEPVKSQIAAKLGSYNGKIKRTAAPLGGTIALDIPGSAQGAWMNAGQPTFPEGPHLALVPDNLDPVTTIVLSVGLSQPGFQSGQYRFAPRSSGNVNRHPAQLSPDAAIYCYETNTGAVLLIQMTDATTLRMEGRQGQTTCALQQPFAFSIGATFDYKR